MCYIPQINLDVLLCWFLAWGKILEAKCEAPQFGAISQQPSNKSIPYFVIVANTLQSNKL